MENGQNILKKYFEENSEKRDKWIKFNRFYHRVIEKQYSFIIPENSKVLELGCSTGNLLNAVKPSYGLGIDFSETAIKIAKQKYPHLNFQVADIINFSTNEEFDYIIVSDLISSLWDLQAFFKNLRSRVKTSTKIIISTYNYLWEPILKTGETLGLKAKQPLQNWLSIKDIENLLKLENFEVIKVDKKLLFPKYIPVFNFFVNKFLANLPGFNAFNLINFITVIPTVISLVEKEYSTSIVVPSKNEKGNIENAILRTPAFGLHQEFIFIEGGSQDGTYEEILRVQKKYPGKDIKVMKQTGKGKGNAVKEAFEAASGDILMILDADMTTPPEDMTKFYSRRIMN